ncbi:roadblock/LC7 domain-containing protein [Amycolatopsis decaplanina]|uniref:Roadblock/lc7 family protein n=1 Tax=Amycolatopsis decaplanina DSM 44594 TaxID=1284240 RepID=M2Z9C2_9PSEU|nr:roadblock/LC7 domain-containing protein [Amycolatopsis decaplanina]EME63897.1 roadblock/lc7 family protein [Amycolatopsis decaplanina DSM 44594]
MDRETLADELNDLRKQVSGVTGALIAGVDGLLIAADAEDRIDPGAVSALGAAQLGLSLTITSAVDQGAFRHAVVRGSGGYLAVYSVDSTALLVVLGDEGLDVTRLHRAALLTIERVRSILAAVIANAC